MSEIVDYLDGVGFTDYADGYKAKCYDTWGIYIFNVKESKLIDKHLHDTVEYKVESVEDVKRILEKKGIMSATNSLHYQLCVEGAKWLRRRKHDYKKCEKKPCHKGEFCRHCLSFKYVAVELNTYCTEQTDVWGYDGNVTAVIEVKTSHSDFLADSKKWWRSDESKECGLQAGMLRWYLCPSGVINADELPSGWGLLYWDGKNIEHVVAPTPFENTLKSDMRILYSLLRREGFKEKIYNYRGTNTTIKPKAVLDVDEMKPLDSDISNIVSEHLFDMV